MARSPGRQMLMGRPRMTPGAAWILGIQVGVFLVYVFASKGAQARLLDWFALTPRALAHGHVWKLATTALFNASGMSLLMDVLMLWLFVPVLEDFWGTRRFLIFAAATLLAGNLASALVGLWLGPGHMIAGLSPFLLGAVMAFGVTFADQPVQLFGVMPIRGKVLAWGTVIFLLLFVLLDGQWVDAAGYFTGMAVAWGMTSGAWSPNLWWLRLRRWRLRRRVTVLDGGASRTAPKKRWMN